jgi:hypothetical protein
MDLPRSNTLIEEIKSQLGGGIRKKRASFFGGFLKI